MAIPHWPRRYPTLAYLKDGKVIECLLDFETASACDLKVCGAWRYSEDPTTEVLCLAYQRQGDVTDLWVPGGLPGRLATLAENPDVLFIAHNAAFEKAIWRNIMVKLYGFPDIPNSRFHDTMAVCAMKVIPLDLDHALRVLRLPHQKDKEGSRLTISLSKPNKKGYYDRTPETLARVYDYCRSDIAGEVGLHHRIGYLPASERNVWLLDQRINERGVRLDLPFIRSARRIVERATVPLAAEFQELTGGLAFTQRAKIMDWVTGQGVGLKDLKAETLDAILGSEDEDDDPSEAECGTVDLPENVHRALSIRRLIGSAAVKKLPRMEACVCEDGRARGLLQYHGAGPGRWAGRIIQPQNFPRGTIKVGGEAPAVETVVEAILTGDPAYVEMLLGPAVEAVVGALRHSIVASTGRGLLAGDFAGIEARFVLALAGQHDKTALMASGADVYCDMASQIYKRPIDKKKDPAERQTGKNSVLGLGFQMGGPKFKLRYAKDQPLEFAKDVVSVYRTEWAPEVPKVWKALENAALATVQTGRSHETYGVTYTLEDGWMTARLPSTRKLWYFNPQNTRKAMPWDPTDIRPAWSYQAKKMGKWLTIDAFGGLLTENVVQALARDLMVSAMFRCEKNGLPIILTVHDEIVAEPVTADCDPKTLTQIMIDSPEWARMIQVPVAVEAWAADRYKK